MISIIVSLVLCVCTDGVNRVISIVEGSGRRQTSTEKAAECDEIL